MIAAKVLLVDADSRALIPMKASLWAAGHEVVTAGSGREALALISKERPQAVLSSFSLPDMDGLVFLREVRSLDPELIVLLSGADIPMPQAAAAIRQGAYQILDKAAPRAEVGRLIEAALRTSDLRTLLGVYESSQAVFSHVELDELLPAVVRSAAKVLKAADVSLMLLEEDGSLAVAETTGPAEDGRRRARVAVGEGVAGKVAQTREPLLLIGRLEGASVSADPEPREPGSSIVYPLTIGEEFLGVLNINRGPQDQPFGLGDIRTAAIFGALIAQALRNAKLYQGLRARVAELDSAKRRLEETQQMLLQSTKLASVGELASGLAHELNNPLTSVIGFAKFLLKADNLTPEQKGDVERILKESRRCSEIVHNIRHFARLTPGELQPVALRGVVEGALGLFRCNVSGVEIEADSGDVSLRVSADQSQIQQALLQILKNAKDAVAGRPDAKIRLRVLRRGARAVVEVADNGGGIPAAILPKIFDPFFTTKPPGQGVGLGLSVALGIMEQHDGNIQVVSTEGQGAAVSLELPVFEEKA